MKKKVFIFSYEVPHLKSLDLAKRLILRGYSVTILGFPFKKKIKNKTEFFQEKTNQLFEDRPNQLIEGVHNLICTEIGAEFIKIPSWEKNQSLDALPKNTNDAIYITCISKIIPREIIEGRVILNAHPGLLPDNRGVDAFKWSITKAIGVGVTVHAINHEIDSGVILARVRVPIYKKDTLEDVALRNYNLENLMLENFELYIGNLFLEKKVDSEKYRLSKNPISNKDLEKIGDIFKDKKKYLIKLSKVKATSIIDYQYDNFLGVL